VLARRGMIHTAACWKPSHQSRTVGDASPAAVPSIARLPARIHWLPTADGFTRRYLTPLAFLLALAASPRAGVGAPHRTGWSVGVGPRVQWPIGKGYDELTRRAVGIGRGAGAEAQLAYGLTPHWELRVAVSTAAHAVDGPAKSSGIAWAAGDLVLRQPIGRLDLVAFGRVGEQAVTLDRATIISAEPNADYSWTGLVAGGGGGLRVWIMPHVSLDGEAAWTYVRISDEVLDATGSSGPLRTTFDGTTWGTTVSLAYHW